MHIFVWHVSTSGYTPGPRGRNMSVPSPATTPGRPLIDLVSRSRRWKVVILSSVALAILFCNMQVAIVYILSPEVWRADHEVCTNLLTRFAGRADAVFGLAITSMATDIDLSFRYEITYLQSHAESSTSLRATTLAASVRVLRPLGRLHCAKVGYIRI